jgi:hypothetical protein
MPSRRSIAAKPGKRPWRVKAALAPSIAKAASRRHGCCRTILAERRAHTICTYSIDFVRFWSVRSFRIIGSSCRSGRRDGSSPPLRTNAQIAKFHKDIGPFPSLGGSRVSRKLHGLRNRHKVRKRSSGVEKTHARPSAEQLEMRS